MKPEFAIDPRSAIPVYQQIKQEIRRLILSGDYRSGDQLIPIRELAKQLSVNPNTIVKVYYQLDVEGYIHPRPGQGYFVSDLDPEKKNADHRSLFVQMLDDFLHRLGVIGFGPDDLIAELTHRKQ